MFLSPLVRQILASLQHQPDEWRRDGRLMRRADGVAIQFMQTSGQRAAQPRLCVPREVRFTGLEAFVVMRAIRKWLHRPI